MKYESKPPAKINTKSDYHSKEGRAGLTRMTMKLFDLWGLSDDDQLNLLGLNSNGQWRLRRYRKGGAIEDRRDILDRVGHLLAIYRSLRILWPHNTEIQNAWISSPKKDFGGENPLEIMKREGIPGMLIVRRYLESQLER